MRFLEDPLGQVHTYIDVSRPGTPEIDQIWVKYFVSRTIHRSIVCQGVYDETYGHFREGTPED